MEIILSKCVFQVLTLKKMAAGTHHPSETHEHGLDYLQPSLPWHFLQGCLPHSLDHLFDAYSVRKHLGEAQMQILTLFFEDREDPCVQMLGHVLKILRLATSSIRQKNKLSNSQG